MTTLRIQFPANWPGWTVSEYTLDSVLISHSKEAVQRLITVSVDSETRADYSSDSPVFRASLIDSSISRDTTVVLKFALREDLITDLAEEADVYTGALEPLQGTTVPHCYGLYAGLGEDGEPVACLMLECWGECIGQPFEQLPLEVRIRILQRLGEIHRQGLLHGDFAERNVLELDGDIRIIDFDQTESHNCDCDMDFHPGEKTPDAMEFGCEQLWNICRCDMGIWDSAA